MRINYYDILGKYVDSDPKSYFYGEIETIEDEKGTTNPFAIIQHDYNGFMEIPMHSIFSKKNNFLIFYNDLNDKGHASLVYIINKSNDDITGNFTGRALISNVDLYYSGLVMLSMGEKKYAAIFDKIQFRSNISVPIIGTIKLEDYEII
ncbi:hypothetical protein K9M18_03675 [Candidatus Woesearchaeota archaeon]|nr:hypothetical protein [Candidatus Woesearchaeota archaeon]MCF8013071.1 hypothetical protein [Candidatus Woesearchaeota archaeon]